MRNILPMRPGWEQGNADAGTDICLICHDISHAGIERTKTTYVKKRVVSLGPSISGSLAQNVWFFGNFPENESWFVLGEWRFSVVWPVMLGFDVSLGGLGEGVVWRKAR